MGRTSDPRSAPLRCFDARKIDDTGIGRYIRCLLPRLIALDERHAYAVILPPNASPPFDAEEFRGRVRIVVEGARNYTIQELVRIPYHLQRLTPALLHEPHYTVPLVSPCPKVVTVHDLIHMRYPEHRRSPAARLYVAFMMRRAVAAERIVVPSASTRDDLVHFVAANPDRIRVIPEAVDPIFCPEPDQSSANDAPTRVGLHGAYLMYAGMWKPHKNLPGLLRAFAGLVKEGSWDGQLAIVGRAGQHQAAVGKLITELGLRRRVVVTGFVKDEDLLGLYRGATAVVHPALYEGFGLTILEAMACGTPVVATDVASLREVAGDAAMLVPPNRDGELLRAMRAVLGDETLRKWLSALGRARAARFSWERTAEATLAVYDELSQ